MKNPQELCTLPAELIHAISGHLEQRDLLGLCQTGRRMHAICLRWIYRALTLENVVQLLQCCKTIISRPEAADSVRELKITCVPNYALKTFYSTFEFAITRMKNIREITLFAHELFRSFSNVSFPRLLNCTIPISLDVYPFLRRNPTITSLSMEGPCPNLNSFPIQPMQMPKLQYFHGPNTVACSVVPGSLVSRIAVFWLFQPNSDFSRDLAAFATSMVDIINLTGVVCSWNPDLLVAVAKYTPRIQSLHISNIKDDSLEQGDFISAVNDTLRSVPCLKTLIFNVRPSLLHRPPIWESLESEFEIVHMWGQISPTLFTVSLSPCTVWGRVGNNAWFPRSLVVAGHSREAMDSQCLKWWITKVVTSPELPEDYYDLADYFAGETQMDALRIGVERDGLVPDFNIVRREDGRTQVSFLSHP
ncbi:hypothetical protein MVEN_00208400 [Mycena venus]|uniref:F-box domain-containing protein n=1 Tax=Mycena venus TaxID=2733690 RepID=A0A8H7DDD1_9AGAR|nr:hypothetical protein MVEN_00208400 [Mycena venus]